MGRHTFHDEDIIMSTHKGNEKISFRESKVAYADSNIFTFFTLPLLRGSAKNALTKPFSIVISERTARKYFGSDDPMGRTLTINDSLHLVITGIFKNLPHNTHLDFEILISTVTIGNSIFSMAPKNMFALMYTLS